MNKLFAVLISCLITLFCVNVVISDVSHLQLQPQSLAQQPFQPEQGQFAPQSQGPFPAQSQFPGQAQFPGQSQFPAQSQPQYPQQQDAQPGAQDAPVTQTCLGCICEAISGCNRTTTCSGETCGLFKITWAYWADSGKPTVAGEAPTSETAYANCANDAFCAASAVQGYMKRFGQDCNEDGRIDCYDHASIHYRGGYGCKGELPEKYRNVFNTCLSAFLKA